MENNSEFMFVIFSNILVTILAIVYFVIKLNKKNSDLPDLVYSFLGIFFSAIMGWMLVEAAILIGFLFLLYKTPEYLIKKYRIYKNLDNGK